MGFSVNRRNRLRSPACAGKRFAYSCRVDAARDHPRVCGEKDQERLIDAPVPGSPPRVRGKDTGQTRYPALTGITPACAGKRYRADEISRPYGDHPRVCGEKRVASVPGSGARGSPPRVRGKVRQQVGRDAALGITPACAGKRQRPVLPVSSHEDHPRVCGEKYVHAAGGYPQKGSPPRVRGKGPSQAQPPRTAGITPACAGKSSARKGKTGCRGDHPRVCGEKVGLPASPGGWWGSPPRVRGKAVDGFPDDGDTGITPACAGKRLSQRPACGRLRDHPRVCGEKAVNHATDAGGKGSPPRVRGKAGAAAHPYRVHRITPACAGKSAAAAQIGSGFRDHPRVCGEKTKESLKK